MSYPSLPFDPTDPFLKSTPLDTDPVSEGAGQIRSLKTALQNFLAVGHDMTTGALKTTASLPLVTSLPTSPVNGQVAYLTATSGGYLPGAYIYLSGGWTALVKPGLPVGAVATYGGTVANMPAAFAVTGGEWKFCNGDSLSAITYAELFLVLGTAYGGSGGSFNIPDLRDHFVVGAKQDDSGSAKSAVSDGSTLLKSRAFTEHNHLGTGYSSKLGTNGGDGGFVAGIGLDNLTRAIPPFVALAYVIRVK